MTAYTIELSDAEAKALAVVALDPEAWIENVVRERCRVAMEDIIQAEVKRKLDAGEDITGSRDDIVLAAHVLTAAEAIAAEQEAANV